MGTRYGQRGMDGGKDPSLEPAVNGYISCENGVKIFFAGGSKDTPAPKMGIEVVGSDGRIIIDNTGDGRNKRGEWTGTYRATGTIWRGPDVPGERHNMVAESFSAPNEYEHSLAPPDPTNPDESLPGISAGVRDLIAVLLDDAPIVSPPQAAQNVVEVLSGFVASAHAGNVKVQLPLPRREAEELAEALADATAERGRL